MWVCFLLSNMIQERTARSIITQGHDMHSRLAIHYNIFFITYNMLFPTLLHLFVPTPKDLYFILDKGILRRIQLFTYRLKQLNAVALFWKQSKCIIDGYCVLSIINKVNYYQNDIICFYKIQLTKRLIKDVTSCC